jgi:bile acid:Na+ symporter, BASS family
MNILENSKFVFFFFIVLGFIFPIYADDLKILLIPSVIIMMIISIKDVHIGHFNKSNYKKALKLIFVNYFLLSPIYIALALLFIKNPDYKAGFIILASVPPAASIIPLTYIYHGDIKDTILGEIACYLFALIYSPLIVYFFLGKTVNILFYVEILFLIILFPILISRLIHNLKWKIFKKKNIVVNLIYGFSFYIFIGLNQSVFLNSFSNLIPVACIIVLGTFILGYFIFHILKQKKVKKREDIMYVLFGTFKNGNTAAALSIMFFGPAGAIPIAVRGLLTPFYFVFMEWMFKEHKKIVNK